MFYCLMKWFLGWAILLVQLKLSYFYIFYWFPSNTSLNGTLCGWKLLSGNQEKIAISSLPSPRNPSSSNTQILLKTVLHPKGKDISFLFVTTAALHQALFSLLIDPENNSELFRSGFCAILLFLPDAWGKEMYSWVHLAEMILIPRGYNLSREWREIHMAFRWFLCEGGFCTHLIPSISSCFLSIYFNFPSYWGIILWCFYFLGFLGNWFDTDLFWSSPAR